MNCSSEAGSRGAQIMDTQPLRLAAAPLGLFRTSPDGMVQQPQQQNAAQWFQWLLDTTQEAIGAPDHHGLLSGAPLPQFWSKTLEMVSQEYGHAVGAAVLISHERMSHLAAATRAQLLHCDPALASLPELLRSDSARGLMRRVADLDWWLALASRTAADTATLGALFESQLVEVSMCLHCRRVYLDTHSFRLLSVPLPRTVNSATATVTLTECLTWRFGQPQGLTGVSCEQCCNMTNKVSDAPTVTAAALSPIMGAVPFGLGGASTSTPVYNSLALQAVTSTPTTGQQGCGMTGVPHQSILLLARAPPLLALHLTRPAVDHSDRVARHVLLPQELHLREMCLDDDAGRDLLYQLYGCVLRYPAADKNGCRRSPSAGHYVALCQLLPLTDQQQQQWIRCDDECVQSVSAEAAWRELHCELGPAQVDMAFYARAAR